MLSITCFVLLVSSGAYSTHTLETGYARNQENSHLKNLQFLKEQISSEVHEDAKLLVPKLIQKYGYPCEIHTITTSDGYILELHRIPHGKNNHTENKSVVLLNHGLLSSSADWILSGINNALPYLLADAGNDVWMMNSRGTRYSRKHVDLDPDKDAKLYWDFSFHEIGVFDVSTSIDFITEHTKQINITYIGHSQGCTTAYVLLAEKPKYNDKFKSVISLAPSAFEENIGNPVIQALAPYTKLFEIFSKSFGIYEIKQTNQFVAQFVHNFCGDHSKYQPICTHLLYAICGYSPQHTNASFIPIVSGHTPAGASAKQFFHYSQEIISGKFRQYDYGLFENLKRYGRTTPPDYNLKNIKVPVHIFYSKNDLLSSEKDVMQLSAQLDESYLHLVANGTFNHIDYLYAIRVRELLHNDIVNLVNGNNS